MKKRHRGLHLAAGRRGEPKETRGEWIPEEVGSRLREGVPSCSSGTAQEKRLQENWDSGKFVTAKGVGRCRQEDDPPCRSGMTQKGFPQGGGWASNRAAQKEFTDESWRKRGNEGSRRQAAAIREKERATAIGSGGWSSRQLSPLGKRGPAYKILKNTLELEFVRRVNRMSSEFRKMRKLTLWISRSPPKRKRDRARRSRKCAAPATRDNFAPPFE
jgi:hypothetical protein